MNPFGYWMAVAGIVLYVGGVALLHYRVMHASKRYDVLGSFEAAVPLGSMFLVMPIALSWAFNGYDVIVTHAIISILGLVAFGMAPMSVYSRVAERRFKKLESQKLAAS